MCLVEGSLKLLQLEVAKRRPVNQQQRIINMHLCKHEQYSMLIVFSEQSILTMWSFTWWFFVYHSAYFPKDLGWRNVKIKEFLGVKVLANSHENARFNSNWIPFFYLSPLMRCFIVHLIAMKRWWVIVRTPTKVCDGLKGVGVTGGRFLRGRGGE